MNESVTEFWDWLKREAAFGRCEFEEACDWLWTLQEKGWYEEGWSL